MSTSGSDPFLVEIGDREWEVVFVSRPPVDDEGNRVAVLIDEDAARLVVCRSCSAELIAVGLVRALVIGRLVF